jgi:undecaprenyl-phosphate 4-deoxy-4-formamido-L-arabinose transferase
VRVSVVIPVYLGAATVGRVVEDLVRVMAGDDLQVVLVNDASPDNADAVCRALVARFPAIVTYLRLARNFGEHNAVMAGLHHATGDWVVIMDDDFQNPPEEVPRLVRHAAESGRDVVYTRYEKKAHSLLRNLGSAFNDRVARVMLDKPKDLYLSSFKCVSRFAVGEILKYDGPYPYLDGLILRATRSLGVFTVRHDAREVGRSGYTLRKLARLWLNMFTNFSVLPLRASSVLGLLTSLTGLVLGAWVVEEKLAHPEVQAGWPSLIVTVLLFSGVGLVMLGVIGEYLGRLFLSVNRTPQFVVREVVRGSDAAE